MACCPVGKMADIRGGVFHLVQDCRSCIGGNVMKKRMKTAALMTGILIGIFVASFQVQAEEYVSKRRKAM